MRLNNTTSITNTLTRVLDKKHLFGEDMDYKTIRLPSNFKESCGGMPSSLLYFISEQLAGFVTYDGLEIQPNAGDCSDISNNFYDGLFSVITNKSIISKSVVKEVADAFALGKQTARTII